jgi:hypothetical protein
MMFQKGIAYAVSKLLISFSFFFVCSLSVCNNQRHFCISCLGDVQPEAKAKSIHPSKADCEQIKHGRNDKKIWTFGSEKVQLLGAEEND